MKKTILSIVLALGAITAAYAGSLTKSFSCTGGTPSGCGGADYTPSRVYVGPSNYFVINSSHTITGSGSLVTIVNLFPSSSESEGSVDYTFQTTTTATDSHTLVTGNSWLNFVVAGGAGPGSSVSGTATINW